ncbi:arrestin C-terminal domain-containing protein [Aspergillus foveolatus]|uniref:arrestin C-terminal domain-containing protein n=1 Tax=Aspergillus foveolatus TaxID=210207 RepID=UPI003CCC9E61
MYIFLLRTAHLSLTRAASFKRITVRVIGIMKTPQYGLFLGGSREQVTFERSQTIAYSKMREFFTMPKGDYEFLFEIPLPGALYDTLTGPNHEYHAYRVEVSVVRWMWPNLVISQPLRVHRYPMLSTGLGLSKAVKSCSSHDLEYNLSIPDTLVPHGSAFPVECWFRLSEGVTLSDLTVRVIERHRVCFTATATQAAQYDIHCITSDAHHVIVEEKYSYEDRLILLEDMNLQQISVPVRLPAGEGTCSQSYSSRNIQIEHVLVIEAELKNKDGESNTSTTYLRGSTNMKPKRIDLLRPTNGTN